MNSFFCNVLQKQQFTDVLINFESFFFYRTPPVAASLVFAAKQLNIQCYNDNFGLELKIVMAWKYCNYIYQYIHRNIYFLSKVCPSSTKTLQPIPPKPKLHDPLKHLLLYNFNIFEGEWCIPQLYSVTYKCVYSVSCLGNVPETIPWLSKFI